jgi:hypothetical protein
MDWPLADQHEPFAFGLGIAGLLVNVTDDQWPEIIEELRRTGELSQAVGDMTQLLNDPTHRDLAIAALRRIGLYLPA